METIAVIYKMKTAEAKIILKHLVLCKDDFIPVLDSKTNLPAYAKKIAENAVTFEAWLNSDLIGLIAAYFNDINNQTGFITNVSIIKEHSGKGVVSQLLSNCIKYAKENNFKGINLEVNSKNQQALKLYERYDFRVISTNADLKTMQLNL